MHDESVPIARKGAVPAHITLEATTAVEFVTATVIVMVANHFPLFFSGKLCAPVPLDNDDGTPRSALINHFSCNDGRIRTIVELNLSVHFGAHGNPIIASLTAGARKKLRFLEGYLPT